MTPGRVNTETSSKNGTFFAQVHQTVIQIRMI